MVKGILKIILGALVIVFAWWDVSWAAIALTIIGALIIVFCLMYFGKHKKAGPGESNPAPAPEETPETPKEQ
jgi:Na+-transporting NADH:ubiquinone oxidoreductase subunit NqrB